MARVLSGLILTAAVIAIILKAPYFVCQYVVVVISLICAWEFFSVIGATRLNRLFGIFLIAIGVSLALFRAARYDAQAYFYVVMAVTFLAQLFGPQHDNKARYNQAASLALGVVYVSTGFIGLGLIFLLPYYHFWIFLALACTFMGDTGAFIGGKLFGRTKLAPAISPGKTVEGLAGGLLGGIVAAIAVRQIFLPVAPLGKIIALGLIIALIGAVGDLSESLIKRAFAVKDSGNLIPGHGGLLDRVDGLMFSAPFVYVAASWVVV